MDDIVKIADRQRLSLDSLGIETLNDMQLQAIDAFRKEGDVVVLSPTGTGKTLAFLLPLLEMLHDNADVVQAVVVLPTRELAHQVADVWKGMNTGFKAVCLHGGRSVGEELAVIKGGVPALVIATPGRLNDHLSRGTFDVHSVRLLVIDEFDKALELGFKDEMEALLAAMPGKVRRFLLSATDSDDLQRFVSSEVCHRLDFTSQCDSLRERTAYYYISTTQKERLNALCSLLCLLRGEQAIVFCNFREMVDEVGSFLKKNGVSVVVYHGGLEQRQRELALYKFKSACSTVLVCTDLAARGLDIPDVRHVVHYQRPVNEEAFVHRNGRTARWSADGAVYMLAIDGGDFPDYVPEDIAEYSLSVSIPMPAKAAYRVVYVGKGKRDKISRGDIAGFFMKKGGAKPDDLGTIVVYDRYSYVAVKNSRVRPLLAAVASEKIKGLKTIVEEIKQ